MVCPETTEGLLEKYQDEAHVVLSIDDGHRDLVDVQLDWKKYGLPVATIDLLRLLEFAAPAMKTKALLIGNPNLFGAALDALSLKEPLPVRWILGLLYDMLRADSSCFSVFDAALKNKQPVAIVLSALIGNANGSISDTALWLVSAIMGQCPSWFTQAEVLCLVEKLEDTDCSDLAKLEAVTNVLKNDVFRATVWAVRSVRNRVLTVDCKTAQPAMLYKCVFSMWLLSFDQQIASEFKQIGVVQKLDEILGSSRTEKVVRICLTLLKGLLDDGAFSAEIVETNLHATVVNLEYEKWRDAELYDEIRAVANQLSNELQLVSNFDRYEHELYRGVLKWGFVHTSKFFRENIMKFEHTEFSPIKALGALVHGPNSDTMTLAVACHDIGEFVALHPMGKTIVTELSIKERVMELMASSGDDMHEVRREALLCCQKIMLNNWQSVSK